MTRVVDERHLYREGGPYGIEPVLWDRVLLNVNITAKLRLAGIDDLDTLCLFTPQGLAQWAHLNSPQIREVEKALSVEDRSLRSDVDGSLFRVPVSKKARIQLTRPIDGLGLTRKTEFELRWRGISTLAQVVQRTSSGLGGLAEAVDLLTVLIHRGLSFGMDLSSSQIEGLEPLDTRTPFLRAPLFHIPELRPFAGYFYGQSVEQLLRLSRDGLVAHLAQFLGSKAVATADHMVELLEWYQLALNDKHSVDTYDSSFNRLPLTSSQGGSPRFAFLLQLRLSINSAGVNLQLLAERLNVHSSVLNSFFGNPGDFPLEFTRKVVQELRPNDWMSLLNDAVINDLWPGEAYIDLEAQARTLKAAMIRGK